MYDVITRQPLEKYKKLMLKNSIVRARDANTSAVCCDFRRDHHPIIEPGKLYNIILRYFWKMNKTEMSLSELVQGIKLKEYGSLGRKRGTIKVSLEAGQHHKGTTSLYRYDAIEERITLSRQSMEYKERVYIPWIDGIRWAARSILKKIRETTFSMVASDESTMDDSFFYARDFLVHQGSSMPTAVLSVSNGSWGSEESRYVEQREPWLASWIVTSLFSSYYGYDSCHVQSILDDVFKHEARRYPGGLDFFERMAHDITGLILTDGKGQPDEADVRLLFAHNQDQVRLMARFWLQGLDS